MRTEKIELRYVKMPMANPMTTSFGRITDRHIVIAKFFTDLGITFAESPTLESPSYTSETHRTVLHMLTDFIGPFMLKNDVKTPEELHERLRWIKGNNMAKHIADTAMYHLLSKAKGVPLHEFLGGTRKEVHVGLSIGVPSIDELLKKVSWAVNEGFKKIKIKIKPGFDIVPVRAIRENFGDVPLMVDANSAYTLDHSETFQELDKYNLMMIEQPLQDDDILDHAKLQKQISTPICLDESIVTYDNARHAIEAGACKIINIKPARVGGLFPSIKIHDLCRKHGIPVWIGGLGETAIGKLDNVAIATLPGFSLPGDIGPSHWYFNEDLINPSFNIVRGVITPPTKPGLGYEVDEERLEKYTVEKFVLGGK